MKFIPAALIVALSILGSAALADSDYHSSAGAITKYLECEERVLPRYNQLGESIRDTAYLVVVACEDNLMRDLDQKNRAGYEAMAAKDLIELRLEALENRQAK